MRHTEVIKEVEYVSLFRASRISGVSRQSIAIGAAEGRVRVRRVRGSEHLYYNIDDAYKLAERMGVEAK